MLPGLYSAASGMLSVESRQEAIANNIANAATPGYKRQQPVQLGFYEVFTGKQLAPIHYLREAAPAGGVKVVETYPDLANGILQHTENPLNLALQGPGFFVVDTPSGERYSRAGNFSLDAAGELTDSHGNKLQSVGGEPLNVGDGQVNIAEDGTVSVDGQPVGRLRVVEFAEPTRLMRDGENLFRASDEVTQQRAEAADTRVVQGKLEMSNVQLPHEMVQMMLGARAYEANQRMITTVDATLGRLIDQIGMPS